MKTIIDFTQQYKNILKDLKNHMNALLICTDKKDIETMHKVLNDDFDKLHKLYEKRKLIEIRYEE